jgi:hypothetical protein
MRLADLLTEALVAYQSVRDSDDDSALRESESSLPGPTSVPDIPALTLGQELGYRLPPREAGEARHRSPDSDAESDWENRRWDLPN